MIGNKIFAFLLMRKKYFDWGRFWKFFYEHSENPPEIKQIWPVINGGHENNLTGGQQTRNIEVLKYTFMGLLKVYCGS